MKGSEYIKGRGAQQQVTNRFALHSYEMRDDFLNYCAAEGEEAVSTRTVLIDTFPKTIVNKVTSPDVGLEFSLNPYQGCEHGCVYCYARNSHEYWGYSAGLDFEQKILVKRNAVELLEQKFRSKAWKARPIVLSGNTDCYQPIERKLQITRRLLQLFLQYRHPVGIITKNALIQRDLDILEELAKDNLVRVNLSITSLEEKTRQLLEPRTASIKKRLQTIEVLSARGIPVNVMMAPIIPSINSHEILPLVKEIAERGASGVGYTVVRLNGAIGQIFSDWIRKALPDRAEKVLHQIEQCHSGSLNDSRFGTRMKGEGTIADQVAQQFAIARKLYLGERERPVLNCVEMAEDLVKVFGTVDQDDAVRAVVVTGNGRAFCAGMDLASEGNVFGLDESLDPTTADLRDRPDDPEILHGVRDTGGRVSLAIHACTKPVIAAVNGPAVGVGATMTLPMDVRIASDRARIGLVFGRIGIVPEACSTWFLPRIVGMSRALELVYRADILSAEEARDAGLVRSVHPHDALLDAAHDLARAFTRDRSPVATALARQMMYRNSAASHPHDAHRTESLAMFRTSVGDGKEGVRAFLEKRRPEFTGRASELPDVFG